MMKSTEFEKSLLPDTTFGQHCGTQKFPKLSLIQTSPFFSNSWKNFGESILRHLQGDDIRPELRPYATRYGGHQFGNWAGQLGDGRAHILGMIEDLEIQAKGAGPTPYSRRGDGLAVVRSSLREFILSEWMHQAGVPTTRAWALAATGESVVRDKLYDGHPAAEPGAICIRTAESFLRFGHFEILRAGNDLRSLQKLYQFVISKYYPVVNSPLELLETVIKKTAHLMMHWQRVGFTHGVMNTDNMSVLGLTIDYGPFGFLDKVELDWTPNTTDLPGRRYGFGSQPEVACWNLQALAVALFPLIQLTEEASIKTEIAGDKDLFGVTQSKATLIPESKQTAANSIVVSEVNISSQALKNKKIDLPQLLDWVAAQFISNYNFEIQQMAKKKLGLMEVQSTTWPETLATMEKFELDFTQFFDQLYRLYFSPSENLWDFTSTSYKPLSEADKSELKNFIQGLYQKSFCLSGDDKNQRLLEMRQQSPRWVPRNHLFMKWIAAVEKGETDFWPELWQAFAEIYESLPAIESKSAVKSFVAQPATNKHHQALHPLNQKVKPELNQMFGYGQLSCSS